MLPVIDYSISFGNILTILSVVGSVMAFIWTMKTDIIVIKSDIGYLQKSQQVLTEAFSQFGRVLTTIAVQDSRITMSEKKIDEMAQIIFMVPWARRTSKDINGNMNVTWKETVVTSWIERATKNIPNLQLKSIKTNDKFRELYSDKQNCVV